MVLLIIIQWYSEFGVENCVTDYVTIPGGVFIDETGAEIHAVRYCGTKFPEVKSNFKQTWDMLQKTFDTKISVVV